MTFVFLFSFVLCYYLACIFFVPNRCGAVCERFADLLLLLGLALVLFDFPNLKSNSYNGRATHTKLSVHTFTNDVTEWIRWNEIEIKIKCNYCHIVKCRPNKTTQLSTTPEKQKPAPIEAQVKSSKSICVYGQTHIKDGLMEESTSRAKERDREREWECERRGLQIHRQISATHFCCFFFEFFLRFVVVCLSFHLFTHSCAKHKM